MHLRGFIAVSRLFLAVADDPAFASFRTWLKSSGISMNPSLDFGVDESVGLRGLVALDAIPKGTELLSVPKSMILTAAFAQENSATWQSCSAPGEENEFLGTIHTSMALFLLEQRAAGSKYQQWTAVMPDSFDGFPLKYSEDDMNHLQASPLRRVIKLEQNAVERDYGIAAKIWNGLTLNEFQWGRLAVKSRVFSLTSISGGLLKKGDVEPTQDISMVPLADFVNHPPDGFAVANASPEYDPKTGIFSFHTVSDIAKGQGIYWDYGFRSNRNSVTRYGFGSSKRVPLTDLPLFFKLPEFPDSTGEAKDLKMALIEESTKSEALAMEPDGSVMHELDLSLTGKTAEALLGHMRFMVFQPTSAAALSETCPGTYCQPISLQNERQALKHLVAVLSALRGSYETTTDHDKELIDSGKLSHSDGAKWHGLLLRFGEKKILTGYGNLLGAIDKLFDLTPQELADSVKERWNNPESDIHRYVRENVTSLVVKELKEKLETARSKSK